MNHDAQGSGIRCIMNYDYAYTVDVWDSAHNSQITKTKLGINNKTASARKRRTPFLYISLIRLPATP
ncbi:hypothetical protein PO124_05235 [Bacillus licheniformis]|nr:hypothetical protein [Bacillus licheniformis]